MWQFEITCLRKSDLAMTLRSKVTTVSQSSESTRNLACADILECDHDVFLMVCDTVRVRVMPYVLYCRFTRASTTTTRAENDGL